MPPVEILEIPLNETEQLIANAYQDSLEKMLGRSITLEDIFKIAMFHSLHLNKCKIAILDSYGIDQASKIATKTTTPKSQTKNNKTEIIYNVNKNRSKNTKKYKQATLIGGGA